MTIKRKDFQKVAALIHEFLLKLSDDYECAELRDTLNLALLHMQRYYRKLRKRMQSQESAPQEATMLGRSLRGMSPMTPFRDAPDRFQWRWINLDRPTKGGTLPADIHAASLKLVFTACRDGKTAMLSNMISKDAHCIDEVDALGRTPLMYAINFGQLDVIQLLLENGAELNAVTHDGSTAVHHACHHGFDDALVFLINYRADLTVQDVQGRAPMHWACTARQTDCLKLLLDQSVDFSVGDNDGMTPAMWACRLDHIDHYALLSECFNNGSTSDQEEYERDNNGRSWFHWSVRRTEPLECLKTILTHDTARLVDNEGKTVMHTAAEQGALASLKEILKICNNDVEVLEARDSNNRTPLILAAMNGHGEVVNQLLTEGADFRCEDNTGATAWHYASKRQLHYCLLIIASYVRKYNRDNGLSGSESDQPSSGVVNGNVVDQKLGLNVQRGRGATENHYAYANTPSAPRHPPARNPRTPRTPRNNMDHGVNSGSATGEFTEHTIQSPPTPRARQHPNTRKYNDSPPMPGDFATTPRAPNIPRTSVGVKRSPQNHRRSMEVDDDRSPERRGGDRKIGSAGKRKRGGYEASDRMSVMSVDSGEVTMDHRPSANPHNYQNTQQQGEQSEDQDDPSDVDQRSVSMSEMVVSDIDDDAQPGEATDEDTPPHSYHNNERHVGHHNYNPHSHHSQKGHGHAPQPRPKGRNSQRSHGLIKHPSPPGHFEEPYYPPQTARRRASPNMEVVSDDRSTHNQYHGGQGSREFVHEYRDSDSPQDSPPAQTGRPQSAAFSPPPQTSPDGRFIPPAHLEPLGGGEKVKKKKKKQKNRIPGNQPWGDNVAAIPPPTNLPHQYSPPQTAQAHGGVPHHDRAIANQYAKSGGGMPQNHIQRGVSPQPAMHKSSTKKKGYSQSPNRPAADVEQSDHRYMDNQRKSHPSPAKGLAPARGVSPAPYTQSHGSAPPPLPQAQPRAHLQRTPAEADLSNYNQISNIDEMDARTKNNVQPRGGSGKSRFPSQMSNGPIPPKNADYTQQGPTPLRSSGSTLTSGASGSGTPRGGSKSNLMSPTLTTTTSAMPLLGQRKTQKPGSAKHNVVPPIGGGKLATPR